MFSALDCLSEKVQKSLHNINYSSGEQAVQLTAINSLCTASGKAFTVETNSIAQC